MARKNIRFRSEDEAVECLSMLLMAEQIIVNSGYYTNHDHDVLQIKMVRCRKAVTSFLLYIVDMLNFNNCGLYYDMKPYHETDVRLRNTVRHRMRELYPWLFQEEDVVINKGVSPDADNQ